MRQVQARWGIPRAEQIRAKSAGCPAFRGGRIYKAELVAWLKGNPAKPGEGVGENLRSQKLARQIAKLDIEIETARGKLIERSLVKEFCGKLIADLFDILDRHLARDIFNQVSRELKTCIGSRGEVNAAHL